MILAVASGKGGTGKTTVSASLASVWPSPVVAVDLDVEEPNLHLFMNPDISAQVPSYIEIPEIDDEKCTRCRACTDICQYKAIGIFGEVVMTFPEMCHGCGACWTICPEKAITPGKRELGQILSGRSGPSAFVMGRLRVGEAVGERIRAVEVGIRRIGDRAVAVVDHRAVGTLGHRGNDGRILECIVDQYIRDDGRVFIGAVHLIGDVHHRVDRDRHRSRIRIRSRFRTRTRSRARCR